MAGTVCETDAAGTICALPDGGRVEHRFWLQPLRAVYGAADAEGAFRIHLRFGGLKPDCDHGCLLLLQNFHLQDARKLLGGVDALHPGLWQCFVTWTAVAALLVEGLHYGFHLGRSAPYVGGVLWTGMTVIYSFFGHKNFSFRVAGNVGRNAVTTDVEPPAEGVAERLIVEPATKAAKRV